MFKETDDSLMRKVARGDSQSFARLFDRHASSLLGYLARFYGSKDRAEDVAQEVWMKVVKQATNYKAQGHFKAWLKTVARNTALNDLRSSKRWDQADNIDDMHGIAEADPVEFESKVLARADVKRLKNLIDELPEAQRVAFVMWMSEDVNYQGIADAMELSLTHVKTLIHRARKSLQACLKETA